MDKSIPLHSVVTKPTLYRKMVLPETCYNCLPLGSRNGALILGTLIVPEALTVILYLSNVIDKIIVIVMVMI